MFRFQNYRALSFIPNLYSGSYKICNRNFFEASSKLSRPMIRPVNMTYKMYTATSEAIGQPPIVILHGILGSKRNWYGMCERLNSKLKFKRKIIAVDLRNHGESPYSPYNTYEHMAKDIAELLRQLCIDKASIYGQNMGGRAGIYFALNFPHLVDRITLGDSSPFTNAPYSRLKQTIHAMKSVTLNHNLTNEEGRLQAANQLSMFLSHPKSIDFLLLNLEKTHYGYFKWRLNLNALEANIEKIRSFPENILKSKQYRGPALIIGASRSNFINYDDYPRIKTVLPKATMQWLDSGPFMHFEKPKELESIITNFHNTAF